MHIFPTIELIELNIPNFRIHLSTNKRLKFKYRDTIDGDRYHTCEIDAGFDGSRVYVFEHVKGETVTRNTSFEGFFETLVPNLIQRRMEAIQAIEFDCTFDGCPED